MNAPAGLRTYVEHWAETHPLEPVHIDCATAVMLKIIDGKCKMKPTSKVVMALLYDAIKTRQGKLLGKDIHTLINNARLEPTPQLEEYIYEKRLLAETMISRPVMKSFKTMIREKGLFDSPAMAKIVFEE